MQEIDQMDMLGFLKIRAWNAQQKKAKKEEKKATSVRSTIDRFWPALKP